MKGNTSIHTVHNNASKKITALTAVFIISALCGACASKESDEALIKAQNNAVELEHRMAAIEGNVQNLNQEVQSSQNRVYDVYSASGKKTTMTARPVPQPVPQPMAPVASAGMGTTPAGTAGQVPPNVPVAYASPISNTQAPTAKPAAAHVPPVVKPVNPVKSQPSQMAAPASKEPLPAHILAQGSIPNPNAKPKAPMGTLDPNTKLEVKDQAQKASTATSTAAAQPADSAVQELSLPPETAMYVPNDPYSPTAQAAPAQTTVPASAPTLSGAGTVSGTASSAPAPVVPVTPAVAQVPQSGATTSPLIATAPMQPAPPIQPAPPAKPKNLSPEKAAYQAALNLVRSGQVVAGRAQFEAFLQNYPNSSLVPNAYYWIGESYYSQANYTNALYAFQQVTSNFPRHHKTSDALLKAGMTYQKLGDMNNAQLQYGAVLSNFPNSNAAKIVRSYRR